jgi:hypothetical protein
MNPGNNPPGKSGRAALKAAFTDPEKIGPSGPVWRFRIPRRSLRHPSQTSPPMRTLMSEWTPIAPFFVTARHGKRQPIFRGETTASLLIKPARTIERNANFYSTNLSSCGIRYTPCSPPCQRVLWPLPCSSSEDAVSRPSKGRVTLEKKTRPLGLGYLLQIAWRASIVQVRSLAPKPTQEKKGSRKLLVLSCSFGSRFVTSGNPAKSVGANI